MSIQNVVLRAADSARFTDGSTIVIPLWDTDLKCIRLVNLTVDGYYYKNTDGSDFDLNNTPVVPIPYFHYKYNKSAIHPDYLEEFKDNPSMGFFFHVGSSVRIWTGEGNRTTEVQLTSGSAVNKDFFKKHCWIGRPSGSQHGFFAKAGDCAALDTDRRTQQLFTGVASGFWKFGRRQGYGVVAGHLQHSGLGEGVIIDDRQAATVATPTTSVPRTSYTRDDTVLNYTTDIFHRLGTQFLTEGNETDTYMGLELEVNTQDIEQNTVYKVRRGFDEKVICKSDATIDGNGFEIVTLPATLRYHKTTMWKDFDEKVKPLLQPEQSSSCGIHIHVNRYDVNEERRAISEVQEQKLDIMLNAEANQAFMQTITGRGPGSHSRAVKLNELKWRGHCQDGTGRYAQLNREKCGTIEFRMFKTVTDRDVIFSYLEFVHSLVEFTKSTSLQELSMVHWCKWFKNNYARYPKLKQLHWAAINEHAQNVPEKVRPPVRVPINEWTFKVVHIKTNEDLVKIIASLNGAKGKRRDRMLKAVKSCLTRPTMPDGEGYSKEAFLEQVKLIEGTLPEFIRGSFRPLVKSGIGRFTWADIYAGHDFWFHTTIEL